jgi:hypothetical protein
MCAPTEPNTTRHQPPGPAYAQLQTPTSVPSLTLSHQPFTDSESDLIAQIIQTVNEDMYWMYLTNLTQWGPRNTGSTACQNAAAYILDQFESMGYWARYCPWTYGSYNSNNVEATINGTEDASEIYIICAHYDTVSAGIGADDDTSGTIAVLMAANLLQQYSFNHTIKFVCFSGEEQGLLGSAVYASQAASQGWNIVAVLNCDMISYAITHNDGANLIVFNNAASSWMYDYCVNVNTEYAEWIGELALEDGGSTWGSDHNSFWDEGYDAVFYFEYTETPYYHTSQDNLQHINSTYACKNFRMILAVLCEMANPFPRSDPPSVPILNGPTSGGIDIEYSFTVVSTDPNGDDVYYMADWGDGTNSGWAGPFASGQTATLKHAWSGAGSYPVKAKAKDTFDSSSAWCTALVIQITDNLPPTIPTIDGPATVKTFTKQTYTLTSTDPESDSIQYEINWGDGKTEKVGPYLSGQSAEASHKWLKQGNFTVKARAIDSHNATSDWAYLPVVAPYHPQTFMQFLLERLSILLGRLTGILHGYN